MLGRANVNDPVWRNLLRDVRFRRALSMAIDRSLINNVLYFGLAAESNNTVMAESPLFLRQYQTQWAQYDNVVNAACLGDAAIAALSTGPEIDGNRGDTGDPAHLRFHRPDAVVAGHAAHGVGRLGHGRPG